MLIAPTRALERPCSSRLRSWRAGRGTRAPCARLSSSSGWSPAADRVGDTGMRHGAELAQRLGHERIRHLRPAPAPRLGDDGWPADRDSVSLPAGPRGESRYCEQQVALACCGRDPRSCGRRSQSNCSNSFPSETAVGRTSGPVARVGSTSVRDWLSDAFCCSINAGVWSRPPRGSGRHGASLRPAGRRTLHSD